MIKQSIDSAQLRVVTKEIELSINPDIIILLMHRIYYSEDSIIDRTIVDAFFFQFYICYFIRLILFVFTKLNHVFN